MIHKIVQLNWLNEEWRARQLYIHALESILRHQRYIAALVVGTKFPTTLSITVFTVLPDNSSLKVKYRVKSESIAVISSIQDTPLEAREMPESSKSQRKRFSRSKGLSPL